jgi:hypothetical protein
MKKETKMASVKRKTVSKAKAEFDDELSATGTGARARKSVVDTNKSEIEGQLAAVKGSGDTVWIHNVSGTEFHVPPISLKTADSDTAEVFEVDEVRPFDKSELENKRFKKCLMDKKLRIVSEEEVEKIEKAREKNKNRQGGKKNAGLHASGLPMSRKAALNYIFECEDIDELEGYQELEDREFIESAIEERIEELEGGEFED